MSRSSSPVPIDIACRGDAPSKSLIRRPDNSETGPRGEGIEVERSSLAPAKDDVHVPGISPCPDHSGLTMPMAVSAFTGQIGDGDRPPPAQCLPADGPLITSRPSAMDIIVSLLRAGHRSIRRLRRLPERRRAWLPPFGKVRLRKRVPLCVVSPSDPLTPEPHPTVEATVPTTYRRPTASNRRGDLDCTGTRRGPVVRAVGGRFDLEREGRRRRRGPRRILSRERDGRGSGPSTPGNVHRQDPTLGKFCSISPSLADRVTASPSGSW